MATAHSVPNEVPSAETAVESDNRDPYGINKHLKLDFFNVIAEPDVSAYNFEVLHTLSNKVYQYTKLFIYRLLAVLIGLPLSLGWGIVLGIYTFTMVWVAAPCRRLCQSVIGEFGIYIQTGSDAILAPVFRSMGQVYSSVRVSLLNEKTHSKQSIEV